MGFEDQELIGAGEVDGITYLWLTRPEPKPEEEPDG